MLRRLSLLILVVCVGLSSALFADQVTLKNGDRLTGTVVKSDGKTLVLHTDALGDVTIQYGSIQDIKTDAELHVTLKGGKTAIGPVTTTNGNIDIATKTAGTVEAPQGDVTLIRNDAEQTAYDKSLHPGLMRGWTGGANIGFSVARGNSETENLALAFNAAHPTLNDKITMYATSIYTTNELASPSTVANLETGGLRYDRNVNPRLFGFVGVDFMSNALQYLGLRSVGGGGLGFHAIKSPNTTLDFLLGGNFTHETYHYIPGDPTATPAVPPTPGVTNNYGALTLGEELMKKLGKSTVVNQKFYFYPDLSDTGQYRGEFDFGTVTKISKWLGWQNQFTDIYVSNPIVGVKKNDLILTTGLNFTFTH